MRRPLHKNPFFRRKGFTIVELTVAVLLTSIVVTIVYATWNGMNRHIYSRERRTRLQNECDRISQGIIAQMRRADDVISWDRTSIRYTASGDTVAWSFDGNVLWNNGTEIKPMRGGRVCAFSLENSNDNEESKPWLFSLTLSLVSMANDTATNRSTVMVRRGDAAAPENDFMW